MSIKIRAGFLSSASLIPSSAESGLDGLVPLDLKQVPDELSILLVVLNDQDQLLSHNDSSSLDFGFSIESEPRSYSPNVKAKDIRRNPNYFPGNLKIQNSQ
jgi:hypothetical protein